MAPYSEWQFVLLRTCAVRLLLGWTRPPGWLLSLSFFSTWFPHAMPAPSRPIKQIESMTGAGGAKRQPSNRCAVPECVRDGLRRPLGGV